MTSFALNAVYAAAQTTLLIVYAAAVLVDPTAPLYSARASRVAGLVCAAVGLALIGLAFGALRSVIQIAPQPKEGGRLITSGVYARFRHPIYTGIAIVVVGLFLRKPTIVTAAAGLLVIAFLVLKSKYEERLLAARYPDYPAYKARTLGVVPLA